FRGERFMELPFPLCGIFLCSIASPMALFSRHHLLGNTVQIKSVSLGEQPPAGFANLREVWWFLSCDL
ncbi:MAG: hypothetical protein KAJ05_05425, partial [Candidatus Latescibacteria bacterium]|nr:hypothetical protein [Candidatus Latescibacterota bacterium]